jgi:hypothetical protein
MNDFADALDKTRPRFANRRRSSDEHQDGSRFSFCRRQDDSDPQKRALVMAAMTNRSAPSLSRKRLDLACADDIEAIRLDADSIAQIDEALAPSRRSGKGRTGWQPRSLAVGAGFVIDRPAGLMFLGRAGTFPNEALKIAAAGSKATPNQFDPVEEKAGALQDWFALKGLIISKCRSHLRTSRWLECVCSP